MSTSAGGSNPISLLKAYSAKNTHLTWLPLHAIVHNVDEFLSSTWTPKNEDRISQIQSRIDTGLKALAIYADTLRPVRDKLVMLSKTSIWAIVKEILCHMKCQLVYMLQTIKSIKITEKL